MTEEASLVEIRSRAIGDDRPPHPHLVHFREKVLDSILVLDVVQHDEPLLAGGDEAGNVPDRRIFEKKI